MVQRAAGGTVRAHKKIVAAVLAGIAVVGLVIGLFLILRSGPAGRRTAPAAPPPRLVSPFTGEPGASLGPGVALKIDNIVRARPPAGLSQPPLRYQLPVGGGPRLFLVLLSS